MAPLTYRAIDADAGPSTGRTVPATAPAPAPAAQEQQLAMLRLMFPTEGIVALNGGFVDQTGRIIYTVERDATGSFTAAGAAERLGHIVFAGYTMYQGWADYTITP